MKRLMMCLLVLFSFVRAVAGDEHVLKPQFPLPDASRPLGIWHLSDPSYVTKDNPSGWNPNYKSKPGSNEWQDEYIAQSLPVLRRSGAQGVMIWDWEGSSLGPEAQYVGQPELAQALNPQFDYKRFSKKIRLENHLSLGICIRANQKIVNGKPVLVLWEQQYETVRDRIAFARREWKVSWVYIDSNAREKLPEGIANPWVDGWLTPSTMWKRLHNQFPGITLIPEHKDAATHLWTMPYRTMWMGPGIAGETGTPAYIRRDIPRAVSFVNCSGIVADELRKALPALRASIAAGDILAIDSWWDSSESRVFAEAYHGN